MRGSLLTLSRLSGQPYKDAWKAYWLSGAVYFNSCGVASVKHNGGARQGSLASNELWFPGITLAR